MCRQLDGIPLAIELAASRLRSMSIDDLSARLDYQYGLLIDRSRRSAPRHQTVTALLDWSYELLSGAEQELLVRLSVFAGGSDLHAVEQVCVNSDTERFEIADRLSPWLTRASSEPTGKAAPSVIGCLNRPRVRPEETLGRRCQRSQRDC